MKKEYDVVIVGAGVSGLMLAKLLNNSSLNILLLEKRDTIKKLHNYRLGTFGDIIKKFNLNEYTIANYSKFGCYSVKEKIVRKYPKDTFGVVDMNKLSQDTKLNCEIITNFNIKQLSYTDEKIKINNEFTTKIIVDCSGDKKIIANKLKLNASKKTIDAYSVAFEMENCTIPLAEMEEFRFIADIRYGSLGVWFYPFSESSCQIGLTDFYSEKFPLVDRQEDNLKKYIRKIEPFKTWLKDANIINAVKKTGPTTTKSTIYADNFLACGDAAGAGTPYIAEGFRIAAEMAESAKKTIDLAFKKEDFTKETLAIHEQNFKAINKHYTWSIILRHLMLNHFTTRSYDIFIKRLNKLSNQEYYDALRSNFTFKIVFKILNTNLLFNVLGNILTNKSQIKKDIKEQNEKRK